MPEITDKQMSKLPKWAKSEIDTLRMRLAESEKRCQQISGAVQTNTRVRLNPGALGDADMGNLPMDSEILFYPVGSRCAWRVRVKDKRLLISGDYSYWVRPIDTNCTEIQFEE